jgi:hypothetical protein
LHFININNFLISRIEVYYIKARKKVTVKNTQPDLMKNGSWEIKGTSLETVILLFKIVGRNKPKISQSRFE